MSKHSWKDPHMIRSRHSLAKALYYTLGVFIFLFAVLHIAGSIYASSIATKSSDDFRSGIAHDLAYLKTQGDAIAKNPDIIKYLLSKDADRLLAVMQQEKTARSIGLMGIANAEGVIISRTKSPGKRGDNAFLTSPVGRVVANRKSAQSVEAPIGFDAHQVFLTTGRPIYSDGKMIGGLFANYLADDDYATHFRDTYLPNGAEVVFYNKNAGTYGDSFSDPDTRKLIDSYFNSGSEWIANGSSGKTIYFKDGSYYIVENIVFPGLESSPGGALVFIPRYDISNTFNLAIALLTLATFIFFVCRHHRRSRNEERGWRYYALVVLTSLPILLLAMIALRIENIGYLKLERIPYPLYNSTLRLQPESGIYDLDFEQRFTIVTDTGDEAINSVQVSLAFDPTAVEVKSIDTASSSCSYIIEKKIDPQAGKIDLSCVILDHPGIRTALAIGDIVVKPLKSGTFDFSFDESKTKVLANDGLGTNVLRISQDGSYRADNFDLPGQDKNESASSTARSFVVFSPTHPNQARWYNKNTAHFVWLGKPGQVYKYAFDNLPGTVPPDDHTTQGSAIDIPIPGDGIYYFHLQLVSGGLIAHYRIESDMTPPSIVAIHPSEDNIVAGDVVRFSFEATDAGSGIQRNYYVDLGSHLFLPVGSELFVPFSEAGEQKVTLRVYDTAGNYSEKSLIIHVEPKSK